MQPTKSPIVLENFCRVVCFVLRLPKGINRLEDARACGVTEVLASLYILVCYNFLALAKMVGCWRLLLLSCHDGVFEKDLCCDEKTHHEGNIETLGSYPLACRTLKAALVVVCSD